MKFEDEAFVYLWQDGRQKPYRYYLGYHKGNPDDSYTHSSTVFESFSKDSIPGGVRRRVLATGSADEMMELETALLSNRKERRWDSYYNVKWYSRAIGNVHDILDENGIAQWKQRISESLKGKPKSNKDNYQWSNTTTSEERTERFGRSCEHNGRWKGGISIGDNKKNYFRMDYAERKKLCKELIKQGLSYYEIKEKHKRALIGYPRALLPQEIKDSKNASRKKAERKIACNVCGFVALKRHIVRWHNDNCKHKNPLHELTEDDK